jgi:hypothetical protein
VDERVMRKPTDAELIAAGWKSPPAVSPPPLAGLLEELRAAELEDGPGCWTMFGPDCDAVLREALKHQPELHLRRKVTKRDGEMWGIASTPGG